MVRIATIEDALVYANENSESQPAEKAETPLQGGEEATAMSFGVIFDMDGVMVLTEEAHWQSWQRVAADRGDELSYESFASSFGQVNADCIPLMFGSGLSAEEIVRIGDDKERAFREIIAEDLPLAPGLIELLADLRAAGALLAVGSSAPPENVDLVLDAGGLREHFAAAVDATQVSRGKPAPDVFLRAAELLGIAPELCAVIEDAPSGIAAARAAGMKAVGVETTPAAEALQEAGADAVVADVASLGAALLLELLEKPVT